MLFGHARELGARVDRSGTPHNGEEIDVLAAIAVGEALADIDAGTGREAPDGLCFAFAPEDWSSDFSSDHAALVLQLSAQDVVDHQLAGQRLDLKR